MQDASSFSGVLLLIILIAIATFLPGFGLWAQWRKHRMQQRRRLFEDALKHIMTWEHRGQVASPESLAGALGLSQRRVLNLVTQMESRGLLAGGSEGLRLTSEGESWALHVMRAHRLWERYLADDADMPMARLHQAAEKAEHELTPESLDVLDAHLGHPQRDPHGDPIPTREGTLAPLKAVSLTEWPSGKPARIVHIEDEPDVIFRQILAAGLRPGSAIRVLDDTPERLVISDGESEHRLAHVVAANIQVAEAAVAGRPEGAKRLSDLREGEAARVIELDAECRGFRRRRLLDLGMTRNARVEPALDNTFGDPRAYRVRGTLIALRKQQADQIWVRPLEELSKETEHAGVAQA